MFAADQRTHSGGQAASAMDRGLLLSCARDFCSRMLNNQSGVRASTCQSMDLAHRIRINVT